MRFQNVLENARLTIQLLIVGLFFSFIINLSLIVVLHTEQNEIEVHMPPQIPVDGLTIKAGDYPLVTIYSFAYYIWQGINYWPNNGSLDYKQTIEQFSPFLTPRFKSFLSRDYIERNGQGEIQDRLRSLQGINGSSFDIHDVEAIGHDTWIVHLHLRLAEHMNTNGDQVKDTAIDYVLRVVRYPVNAKENPWGLALDGFDEDPRRVKTYT